jgi:hypothetical protein
VKGKKIKKVEAVPVPIVRPAAVPKEAAPAKIVALDGDKKKRRKYRRTKE